MVVNFDSHSRTQLDIVLNRFKAGEHLSALSCLNDGVSPSSFNRLYKWLKDGSYTNGRRYIFNEYWSKENPDGSKTKGAYKLRVLKAVVKNGMSYPLQVELNI